MTPCRYFNGRGGCRQGRNCKFSHDTRSGTVSPTPSLSSNANSTRNREANPPPPGVCKFFWSSGRCKFEFGCRFRHTSSIESGSPGRRAMAVSTQAVATLAPFLNQDGLAKITGRGTDIFFSNPDKSMTPSEAHNHLKRFLFDQFRFSKTFDIYAFVTPLNSAHTSNNSWTPEDGQLFLSTIATGNGLLRIIDVIAWTPVSTTAGSDPRTLSFQRSYVPLIRFFSSDFVVKSTVRHMVNGLYMGIMENFEVFTTNLESCMDAIMAARTFKDPKVTNAFGAPLGSQVFASVATVFYECLTRFKNAAATYPQLIPIIRKLRIWVDAWIADVSALDPKFDEALKDKPDARSHIIDHLQSKINLLITIVDREQNKLDRALLRTSTLSAPARPQHDGTISALFITYEGPGEYRKEGPRHDNDFAEIQDIRVAPTHEELVCRTSPFLPSTLYEAPHPLPADSMERLLDIQFRLLREELTAPLRTSIQLVRDDITSNSKKTQLSELIQRHGGKYRSFGDTQDGIMFNVYTNVKFASLTPDRRGLSINLSFDAPPGRAQSSQSRARVLFWQGMSGKRLMQGGLIALVWKRGREVSVHLGVLASSVKEITDSVKDSQYRVSARVVFFDPEVELRILDSLKHPQDETKFTKVMVEAPVMFEAIRPFLEALRVEPESIPFKRYLTLHSPDFFRGFEITPPRYACVPGFAYQLAPLFPPESGINDLTMVVSDPGSVANAREVLKQSRLDASQADAVVDTLLREVSLIQGPPGTGKSFTGVELLRVLLQHARPVLLIAFTNHALDHMLTSILDAGITNKIVRMGSRSADERISKFSMESLEMVAGQSRLNRSFGHHYRELKQTEEEIKKLMRKFTQTAISSSDICQYLQIQYPEHFEHVSFPPQWISELKRLYAEDNEGWEQVRPRGKSEISDDSLYAFWLAGRDLDFLAVPTTPPTPPARPKEPSKPKGINNAFQSLTVDDIVTTNEDADSDDNDQELELWEREGAFGLEPKSDVVSPTSSLPVVTPALEATEVDVEEVLPIVTDLHIPVNFFLAFDLGRVPAIPNSNKKLDDLLSEGTMWAMAHRERQTLHTYWTKTIRNHNSQTHIADFENLREKHEDISKQHNEGKDEIRRQLLKDVDIVGATTTGAAKLTSLLKGLDPRIMLVEEAGQVLEAHILGSLVPSVEHLILIGDPLQLRPTLNNYSLSVDSRMGSELYNFDMSLMERLSRSEFPMSQINIQRRMRPAIANLIRNTLYPGLIDHDLVKDLENRPNVRGFSKNVFFLNHRHKENGSGADESSSRFNIYEVNMIKDLVLYLLRQGCYSQEGDIVVLCAYLGQLAKVRDALSDSVAVVIDERDQEALAAGEEDKEIQEESLVEHVQVSKRVRLRTVDNYQGEEAKIVILSLVRNVGDPEGEVGRHRSTIGFLKSENRTNVALSRAKDGLYILGNATQLSSKSRMWRGVIQELEQVGGIGDGFPIACHRHPNAIEFISEPGKLPQFAPDGGCLRSCDARLRCGHVCPYKCHPDDLNHVTVTCSQMCTKLCMRGHPCVKSCSEQCGSCMFQVQDVELPCGHKMASIPCHRLDSLREVYCPVKIKKDLISCEHVAEMSCSDDPATYVCKQNCGGTMSCCSRSCGAKCHQCQALFVNVPVVEVGGRIDRKFHIQHACQKSLYCAHQCTNPCSQDHKCIDVCKAPCRQECAHARCKQYCSTPCSPCQEPCNWKCAHYSCPLPCGSVCARLPCDRRCEKILSCGHRCQSVCGEDCSIQVCPKCAASESLDRVVDMILQRTLADIDVDAETLDELLITLPKCGHTFTVETLDGVCQLPDYYQQDANGSWLGLMAPQANSEERRKPPTCPTCRIAITSPRYGRVSKSADLDILERNIISSMSQQLNAIQNSIASVHKDEIMAALTNDIRTVNIPSTEYPLKMRVTHRKARKAFLTEERDKPISPATISPDNNKLFDVSPLVTNIWKRTTQPVMKIYTSAIKVANMRSSHVHAWEAAFAFLFKEEMDLASSDPARAPRRPREHAMRMARLKVGQLEPRADKRFLVEAIWVTLQLRFLLADLARIWLKEACIRGDAYPPQERQSWGIYGLFLLDSCKSDAIMAYNIAEKSAGRRQMTRTVLLLLRINLEHFRFKIEMTRIISSSPEDRAKLLDNVSSQKKEAELSIAQTTAKHGQVLPDDHQDWLHDNFLETATLILDEWGKLEEELSTGTFYQPVSLDDKMAIVKAFSFSHTGHFYNCPNGHTFVITECGGAMERSRCPECGAAIGGTGHNLDAQNTRALEFEQLNRDQGAYRSPWAWGV